MVELDNATVRSVTPVTSAPASSRRIVEGQTAYQNVAKDEPKRIAVIFTEEGRDGVRFQPIESAEKAAEFIADRVRAGLDGGEVILFDNAYLKSTVTIIKGREDRQ